MRQRWKQQKHLDKTRVGSFSNNEGLFEPKPTFILLPDVLDLFSFQWIIIFSLWCPRLSFYCCRYYISAQGRKRQTGYSLKSEPKPNRANYSNRGWRKKIFENMFFEAERRRKLFQMKVLGAAIDSDKFSSKSELSSRLFRPFEIFRAVWILIPVSCRHCRCIGL